MRDEVLEILRGVNSDIDYDHEDALIDDELLDSFEVVDIISDLADEFGINIDEDEMVPENFNNVDAICDMIDRLKEEQE